ncbi:MAG: hypothetical protein QXD19_04840 [Candidatus Bathyarchaeia archaeon]
MAEKATVFRKSVVQRILKAIKNGEVNVLEPTVNYDFGVEYPKLKNLGLAGMKLYPSLKIYAKLEYLLAKC